MDVEEAFEDEDAMEEEDDLFTAAEPAQVDRPSPEVVRAELSAKILNLAKLPAAERKHAAAHMRTGTLRRIVQVSKESDLDSLKGLVRAWRLAGLRVTNQTADEIIGRCCNLGRPDIALELSENHAQYGFPPLSSRSSTKLHHALLAAGSETLPHLLPSRPVSATLALLRLSLLPSDSDPTAETAQLTGQIRKVKWDVKPETAEAWRAAALVKLQERGGAWAEAAQRVQAMA